MYILKSATTWYVSNSIPKLAKAYNAKLHDERFFLHVQHLYALKLKQRVRGTYKGVALDCVTEVQEIPKGIIVVSV